LLGGYLGITGGEVEFRYSAHGKPQLSSAHADCDLNFNLSHSGSVALFAFSRRRAVGIDVEQIRADIEVNEIADRFFSESEQTSLRALAKNLQHCAFFACWTRKEAFVKAKGEGLSLPLRQFDVSLTPGRPAEILATRPDREERHLWSLWDLDVGPGCAAAVVVEGKDVRITLH
jgi:4'-phosphopantetheinyl transferase